MIENLAKQITNEMINHNVINAKDSDIYNYCFETTIVLLSSCFILLILSIIFKEVLTTIIFIISFSVFRKTSGGYHANSYIVCGLVSLGSYLLFVLILKRVENIYNFLFIILIVASIIILTLSPIEDKNKPFTDKQYKRFKYISKGLATGLLIFAIVVVLSNSSNYFYNKYFFAFCYGICLVADSLLLSKIERGLRNAKN